MLSPVRPSVCHTGGSVEDDSPMSLPDRIKIWLISVNPFLLKFCPKVTHPLLERRRHSTANRKPIENNYRSFEWYRAFERCRRSPNYIGPCYKQYIVNIVHYPLIKAMYTMIKLFYSILMIIVTCKYFNNRLGRSTGCMSD